LQIIIPGCNSTDKSKETISDTQYQVLIQENSLLKEENEKLKSLNDSMQKEIERYNDLRRLSLSYIGYEQQYRYIESGKGIYWIPSETLIKATSTHGNTLAEVLFAGYAKENETWLFVAIPTFDTPSNNMGWIRESDTQKYTKQILKDIEIGIIIKKGTVGLQDSAGEVVTEQDSKGMIEKRENGKVLVMFAGGNEVWYDEKDLSYPDISGE